MPSYHYKSAFAQSTVIKTDAGYLEVRRDSITWSAAYRAANPSVKQKVWPTLAHWHADIPIGCKDVDAFLAERDRSAPSSHGYLLGTHLSYFMEGAEKATEEELSDAITDFSEDYPASPFLRFLLGKPYDAISRGDIVEALREQGHIRGYVADAPAPVEQPTEKISFAGMTFKEEDEVEIVEEETFPAATRDPVFEEIDNVFFSVEAALEDEETIDYYKGLLVEQFIGFCMRPDFAAAWRASSFERIQMRASLMTWLDLTPAGKNRRAAAAIHHFLAAYPV